MIRLNRESFNNFVFAGQSNAARHFLRAPGDASGVKLGAEVFATTIARVTGSRTTLIDAATGGSGSNRIADPDRFWWDLHANQPGPVLTQAFGRIDAALGRGEDVDAIIWAQGENDAFVIADDYSNASEVVDAFKAATMAIFESLWARYGALPILIQEIGHFPEHEGTWLTRPRGALTLIRDAQAELVAGHPLVRLGATTEGVDQFDPIHFSVAGYAQIARRLAHRAIDLLTADDGDDLLVGSPRRDVLVGRGGNDVLYGEAGDDRLAGGAGDDRLDGGVGDDRLGGGPGRDLLNGGGGDDTLAGGRGRDTLLGAGGNDSLVGGASSDDLVGGAGADTMRGGSGVDRAVYDAAPASITVNLASQVGKGSDAQGDRFYGIENVVGSNHADTLIGTDGRNALAGSRGDDVLLGLAGDDVLIGGAGADVLRGGGGADRARYDDAPGAVRINLANRSGAGSHAEGDTLYGIKNVVGSNHSDTLIGTGGRNVLSGGLGDDALVGLAGDDVLIGGDGADTLRGHGGVDWARYDGAPSSVRINLARQKGALSDAEGDELYGIENVNGSQHADTLIGTNGSNRLAGGRGDDALIGWAGRDLLQGEAGDDSLIGGADADTLVGGQGADTLRGGAGADWAFYNTSTGPVVINLVNGDGQRSDARRPSVRHRERPRVGAGRRRGRYGRTELDHGGRGDDTLVGWEGTIPSRGAPATTCSSDARVTIGSSATTAAISSCSAMGSGVT